MLTNPLSPKYLKPCTAHEKNTKFVFLIYWHYLCETMSKVLAYYHIVFCTRERRLTLPLDECQHLYRFIWKELTDKGCKLLRIGGVQNHIHMLINLNPTVNLANLMQMIKGKSARWLKDDMRFPYFAGWAHEYFASTVSPAHVESLIEYIRTQPQHHLGMSFDEELIALYLKTGIEYDDRDMR